ncbi:hypothetical protein BALAC2494_01759 [Bifidobacterium animalis subsp. lactis CNCM I-2494]|uniref:Uncharacterized protein n=1 Tax=Bifidobacterium animalis subsp. lactis CNCM I-2494 TaxID=1042403 RepID=A0A806FQR3_BIFAN|nr:hypothetical protein BALAC2494_01759 [Bifidobacterium animalis subsp. lactis CNCM I-2494]
MAWFSEVSLRRTAKTSFAGMVLGAFRKIHHLQTPPRHGLRMLPHDRPQRGSSMAFLAETSVKYAAQTPYMVDFAKIPVHVTAELLSHTPVRILR